MNQGSSIRLDWIGDQTLLGRDVVDPRWPSADRLAAALRASALPCVREVVSAFDTVALHFDVNVLADDPRLIAACERWLRDVHEQGAAPEQKASSDAVELKVRYGGEQGPDLKALSTRLRRSVEEIVRRHTAREYVVLAVGFMPGFAYLGGLPEELQAPRLATPRTRVEPGSVGIGGPYTGVYPFASPGGWNLIGRTSATLFDPSTSRGAVLQVGDRVVFKPEPA